MLSVTNKNINKHMGMDFRVVGTLVSLVEAKVSSS